MPYSGPASAYGVIGKTEEAYFKKINAEGGINGRKINFISYDDAYSPPKTVEQARKLVESDEVLLDLQPAGHAAEYGDPEIPELARRCRSCSSPPAPPSGTIRRTSPGRWAGSPTTRAKPQIYAKYILKEKPNAKIGMLYQNDDYGKDYLKGLKDGLGAKAAIDDRRRRKATKSPQPTIDSHIVKLKSTGADVFINITTPKFAAQAIKKNAEIGWKPIHFLNNVSASIGSVIKPAGFENAQDIISSALPEGSDRSAVEERCRHEGLRRVPRPSIPRKATGSMASVMFGYTVAQGLVHVLKRAATISRARTS